MKVTLLGCGTSSGVPRADGNFGDCDPHEPRNLRLRSSAAVEIDGRRLLIDSGPDLRRQMLDNRLYDFEAVFYTHIHADHVLGIDELRWLKRERIRCITDPETYAALRKMFPYITDIAPDDNPYRRPIMDFEDVTRGFEFAGLVGEAKRLDHGFSRSLGLRLGNFAYTADVVNMDDELLASLDGVSVWIVDCLGLRPHPTHAHLSRALRWIETVGPKLAILTHMGLQMDYRTLVDSLPSGVVPGYDGMTVNIAESGSAYIGENKK